MRIIVGITGATGVQMGVRCLEALALFPEVETSLIISRGAETVIRCETDFSLEDIQAKANVIYSCEDMAAKISSGSYQTAGMIVMPCSMKTLSGIANGYDSNLIVRAADVCLKENRKVVLVPRETPLNTIQVRNMLRASEAGCTIVPPVLTFYNNSSDVAEQIDHIIGKILMQFGLDYNRFKPWQGAAP